MSSTHIYQLGIDIGSTTIKTVVLDELDQVVYHQYKRHHTRISDSLEKLLNDLKKHYPENKFRMSFTGSVGMGIAERSGFSFKQEVIVATEVVKKLYPRVNTLIDIGGEDSKMIFFNENRAPDIRMNGNCAGGTGSFIDQIASLLNVETENINNLAENHQHIYPIASRCGVFAKTDIQNLIARKAPLEDIFASVFHAVCIQVLNTLVRGFDIKKNVMFCGGPFTFFPFLKEVFMKELNLLNDDICLPEFPELLPATGAAISSPETVYNLKDIQHTISENTDKILIKNRLSQLFQNKKEFEQWQNKRFSKKIKQIELPDFKGDECSIGIDCGSTTVKIVVLSKNGELLFHFYKNTEGKPLEVILNGLKEFHDLQVKYNKPLKIVSAVSTGYGEDLVNAAYNMDMSVVETIAHFEAAKYINPEVSFILDIGGQDMKAVFIDNGSISKIELNEACSSGCGSFIETFAENLNDNVGSFAAKACLSKQPCDLGTRCTVFMNSKVKQAMRENATTGDISAGLAFSVIKNALFKVLKLNNTDELGDHIVVQGGTFRNPAVHRALEVLTQKKAYCTEFPELMGAFGAALIGLRNQGDKLSRLNLENPDSGYNTKKQICKGCVNNCLVTKFEFHDKNILYSGNKCEKVFSNSGRQKESGDNLFEYKYNLLFNRTENIETLKLKIGIPRALNIYENFPFWHTLFTQCGFQVIVSAPSTMDMYKTGKGYIMSDSICFPAKLVHGHIENLVARKADRIFYPIVVFENNEFNNSVNSYNCPIVTGYPDVIASSQKIKQKYNIPLDNPSIHFGNKELLKKACYKYLKTLQVNHNTFNNAFDHAITELYNYKKSIFRKSKAIIKHSIENNELLFVVASRPYHADHLINQRIPEIMSQMGCNVISEDSLANPENKTLPDLFVIPQWAYPNRIYNAAKWVGEQNDNVQFVQINSFSCGPDAIAIDEATEILRSYGKNNTVIRVDEISSSGSIKLRLRSLVESLEMATHTQRKKSRVSTKHFEIEDKEKIIIAPLFSDIYSPFIPPLFELAGYHFINLPKPDKKSVKLGLMYANNEICYPATIVIGDIIKALKSGKYDLDNIAVGITQTGGQCRASSYLSLIKKAIISAGYKDIPVVSVSSGSGIINTQPGFYINWQKILKVAYVSCLYADSLAKMYYSSAVREKKKGEARKLLDKYLYLVHPEIKKKDLKGIYALLELAIQEFNSLEFNDGHYQKVGIVGEIYVKYNAFGSMNIIDWLTEQGIEVVVPPLLDFFTQSFVNFDADKKLNLRKSKWTDLYLKFIETKANIHLKKTEKILSKYKYYSGFHRIRDIAVKSEKILSLANQYGEGWLIPAEISAFAEEGINNIVSLQPFGCIANQVISKGVEKRIRDLYPQVNLLFLDFDDGTTEVNVLNRLHFLMNHIENK